MNKAFFILIFFAASCSNDKNSNSKQESVSGYDTSRKSGVKNQKNEKPLTPTEFYIKDESQYSAEFLKEFKEGHSNYKTVSLIDDSIIIDNNRKDIILIPTDLPLNTIVTYETKEKARNYTLSVKRINYSTIEYNYSEIINDDKKNQRQGKANIEALFYLGAEGTFEDKEGNNYGMNEYIDYTEKDCWTYIYIGMGSIEKSFLKHGCETDQEKLKTPELIRIQ